MRGGGARPNRVGLRLLSKFVISFVYQINKVYFSFSFFTSYMV